MTLKLAAASHVLHGRSREIRCKRLEIRNRCRRRQVERVRSKSENPAGGKRGFQIRLLGVRGELGQPSRAPVSTARLFQAYFLAKNLVSRFAAESRPAFRSLWLESGTHGGHHRTAARARDLRAALVGIVANAHIPLDGAPSRPRNPFGQKYSSQTGCPVLGYDQSLDVTAMDTVADQSSRPALRAPSAILSASAGSLNGKRSI
jgi:hypothetical protein